MKTRLAIICTHPIQYYAPWFRELAQHPLLELRVFYLWDFGIAKRLDRGFGISLQWDVDLLEGYAHELIANISRDPGTHHYAGIDNPQLGERLRAFAPDALLMFGYAFRSMLQVLRHPPCPVILRGDSHDLAPRTGRWIWARRLLQRWLFRGVAAALPVGRANHAYWRRRGFGDAQLFFTPHCVDNARFLAARADAAPAATALRQQLGLVSTSRLLLFAGKFEHKKQPLALIDAFQQLRRPDTHLLLAGDGLLRPQIEAAAQASGGRIHVLPFQNQSAMPALYLAADLLVLPSVGASETWGLVVNEAMCMQTPVLVSDQVGCQQDLVLEGQTGYVCVAGDTSSLRDALRRALDDEGERLRRAQVALQHIAAYSYAAASAGLLNALQHLAPRRGAS